MLDSLHHSPDLSFFSAGGDFDALVSQNMLGTSRPAMPVTWKEKKPEQLEHEQYTFDTQLATLPYLPFKMIVDYVAKTPLTHFKRQDIGPEDSGAEQLHREMQRETGQIKTENPDGSTSYTGLSRDEWRHLNQARIIKHVDWTEGQKTAWYGLVEFRGDGKMTYRKNLNDARLDLMGQRQEWHTESRRKMKADLQKSLSGTRKNSTNALAPVANRLGIPQITPGAGRGQGFLRRT
jgi:hypothetical protein